MMDEFDKDLILQWYERLEGQLIDVMSHLPPAPENLNSFSPPLASIITDSCALLDSIFRQVTVDPIEVPGKSKPTKRRDLDIVDYAQLYAEKSQMNVEIISGAKVIAQ